MLTDDEIVRLVDIAVTRLGVREVRFTGGEPLLRRGLVAIVAATAALQPRPTHLAHHQRHRPGRVSPARSPPPVSTGSTSRWTRSTGQRFIALTRRDRLADVLAGLRGRGRAGLAPVKINAVLMRGINDDEAVALLRFALEARLRAAFHRADAAGRRPHLGSRHTMVTADEILAALQAEFTLLPDPTHRGAAPAETWLVDGYTDAARTSGEGRHHRQRDPPVLRRLRPDPADRRRPGARLPVQPGRVRPARRAARRALATRRSPTRWRVAMCGKLPGHAIDDPTFLQPARPMSAIGG